MAAATGKRMEIGLVLQGGGALGAYEYGGITALLELMEKAKANGRDIAFQAVTGVSIGAINAACIVGAKDWQGARQQLAALWNDLTADGVPFLPPWMDRDASLVSVPNFYTLRSDFLTMPRWKYFYDTHPMLGTLAARVKFDFLNTSETLFVVTAVDVERGELKSFANQAIGTDPRTVITPRHVLASGSLPPQFPWTEISDGTKTHYYWDGGIVDNTPLGYAIGAFTSGENIDRILVVMNLFPMEAKLPETLAQVNDRANQLRFGNRLHQDKENADRISNLVSTIDELAKLAENSPGGLPQRLDAPVKAARSLKMVKTCEITLADDATYSDPNGFRDFSRDGIERRRQKGSDLTFAKLSSVIK